MGGTIVRDFATEWLLFGISYFGKPGRTAVDIGERTTFLEGGAKHQVKPTALDLSSEGDHLRSR